VVSVRAMLLGREPVDYDIATAAPPEEVRRLFPQTIDVGAAFGVVRAVMDDGVYEVATFRTEGPYLDGRHPSSVRFGTAREDVLRRDFTVNGLLYDPHTRQVLDFVAGRDDLAARLLRTIGDPGARFAEDRLRMLRAVRLASELDFEIAPETLDALRRLGDGLREVSPERIRDELVRILTGPDPARGLALLRDTGLLRVILPEVAEMEGVRQPPEFHPEGDVFEHTRLAVGQLRSPSATLAMATLLHDVGKPPTFEQADRIRFNRHDEVGAEIAEAVMQRLRFSRRETDRVVALVRQHMIFKDLPKMREARVRRLMADPAFPELLELYRADCAGSHGDLSTYEEVSRRMSQVIVPGVSSPRLITGDDLLALGLSPGPRIGEILHAVEDARLEGRVQTREEALTLARKLAGSAEDRRTDAGKPEAGSP
jgi:tRNA nucleotidyltransferase (CCA-adding enzyme)